MTESRSPLELRDHDAMQRAPHPHPAGGQSSRFTEILDHDREDLAPALGSERPRIVRFRSTSEVYVARDFDDHVEMPRIRKSGDAPIIPDYTMSLKGCPEPDVKAASVVNASPRACRTLRGLSLTMLFAIALVTYIRCSPLLGTRLFDRVGIPGIEASAQEPPTTPKLQRRQNAATNYCTRWSAQTAVVNGTMYSFGGRATQTDDQKANTWNNDFLTLDLTKNWDTGAPALSGLPQPSGPPAIANGYLWHSYTSLFIYGGEYSDTPQASPSPYALWEYDIGSKTWTQRSSPQTTAGNNSDAGNQPVQEAAEGAGITIASLGRGYYFGGHQDFLTTAGWSIQTARIYLKSMIEFTFPGYTNDGVNGLSNTPAGNGGAWRNITQGGLQSTSGFTERADGVLIYVPGYGPQGIILGLAGGTNDTFTEMNIIDVFDIASSTWYKQSTHGGPPPIRVNPCAVAASAADGSSTNIYMYGGQNLQPYDQQTQYGDMWILTVPSFTWIQVDDSTGAPPNRAGHACEIWDGQMIVFGGYTANVTCDYPGIYVFDASKLAWQSNFTAVSGGDDLSQQKSQSGNSQGLPGSYGYQVPKIVQSVVGGDESGGATVTSPAAGATGGPLATGAPIVYTATVSGQVVTETGGASSNSNDSTSGSGEGPNIGAIVAGVIAGLLFLLACYLGFCVYLYRRQLHIYKAHVAAAQRASMAPPPEKSLFAASSQDPSSRGPGSSTNGNSTQNEGVQHTDLNRHPSSASSAMKYHEPSFMGVLMRPRRSLRIVNRD